MTVRVLAFSGLRDLLGWEEREWELVPAGDAQTDSHAQTPQITVQDLLESLFDSYPALRDWDGRLLIAVDCTYAERRQALRAGQEVAIMPPVQGG